MSAVTKSPSPLPALDNVGGLAIHIIISKLTPSETASVSCISKRFKDWASEESLWSSFCSQELNLSTPVDPNGNPCSSFKVAYGAWREAYGMYPWSLIIRVKNVWDRIKIWLKNNFPEVLSTLRKGASEDEINESEKSLGVKLPLPIRVLYRFCDGQELVSQPSSGKTRSLCGLIGGYSFYDISVNVFLLPLSDVIKETEDIRRHLGFNRHKPKYIVVAASSFTAAGKTFLLNCEDGQLHVGTKNFLFSREMMPCVPNNLITPVKDAMLLWLEEHVSRLENGIINLREEGRIQSISLFPEQPPLCSSATTSGVQVRASAVFVPEFSDLLKETEKYFFTYSIRMSLKPEGGYVSGMPFDSCQLYWRHWIIKSNDIVDSDIDGEAVIGQFPFLRPGEKEFVYESCSGSSASSGSIEGSFTFLPGRLTDPKGSPFEVEVAKFPLLLPDYIF